MSFQQKPTVELPPVQESERSKSLMAKLPLLLRTLGVAALIVAMYSFLVKGWQSGNDVWRYMLMLGHSGLLTVVGLASGYWLKESKGARLLLTLALISVPANVAILGAFIYSQSGVAELAHYPHYVAWQAGDLNTALLVTACAALVLIAIVFLGFTVLARSMSKQISAMFIVSNAALLLPIRDAQLIAMIVLGLLLVSGLLIHRLVRGNVVAKTREGIIALALLILPLLVMLGRSAWLYSADFLLIAVLSLLIFAVLRQLSLGFTQLPRVSACLNVVSVVPVVTLMFCLWQVLDAIRAVPDALAVPISSSVAALILFEIAGRSAGGGAFYRANAAMGLSFFLLANLMVYNNVLAAISCFVVALAMLVYGYRSRQSLLLLAGLILLGCSGIRQLYDLIQSFDFGGWFSLAVFGTLAIVIASILESQGGRLKSKLHQIKTGWAQWQK